MFNILALATSAVNRENPGTTNMLVIGFAVLVIVVAIILLFVKKKPHDKPAKDKPKEDEIFYLREIRNYVRIVAIIILVWSVLSVASWILAIL